MAEEVPTVELIVKKEEGDPSSSRPASPFSSIPQKRTFEDEHTPAVSSPLNPDFTAATSISTPKAAPTRNRNAREKKETLKKREAKGPDRGTPDRGAKDKAHEGSTPPIAQKHIAAKYKLPPPKEVDFIAPRGPAFIAHHSIADGSGEEIELYETTEQ
jgi:COMPASS component BRE2